MRRLPKVASFQRAAAAAATLAPAPASPWRRARRSLRARTRRTCCRSSALMRWQHQPTLTAFLAAAPRPTMYLRCCRPLALQPPPPTLRALCLVETISRSRVHDSGFEQNRLIVGSMRRLQSRHFPHRHRELVHSLIMSKKMSSSEAARYARGAASDACSLGGLEAALRREVRGDVLARGDCATNDKDSKMRTTHRCTIQRSAVRRSAQSARSPSDQQVNAHAAAL